MRVTENLTPTQITFLSDEEWRLIQNNFDTFEACVVIYMILWADQAILTPLTTKPEISEKRLRLRETIDDYLHVLRVSGGQGMNQDWRDRLFYNTSFERQPYNPEVEVSELIPNSEPEPDELDIEELFYAVWSQIFSDLPTNPEDRQRFLQPFFRALERLEALPEFTAALGNLQGEDRYLTAAESVIYLTPEDLRAAFPDASDTDVLQAAMILFLINQQLQATSESPAEEIYLAIADHLLHSARLFFPSISEYLASEIWAEPQVLPTQETSQTLPPEKVPKPSLPDYELQLHQLLTWAQHKLHQHEVSADFSRVTEDALLSNSQVDVLLKGIRRFEPDIHESLMPDLAFDPEHPHWSVTEILLMIVYLQYAPKGWPGIRGSSRNRKQLYDDLRTLLQKNRL